MRRQTQNTEVLNATGDRDAMRARTGGSNAVVVRRFLRKVRISETGCWEWHGYVNYRGYGEATSFEDETSAHRVAYTLFVGRIPDQLHIDHLCRNPRCVRPDHLEAVTCRVNILRGIGPTAINAAKTSCIYGHPFDEKNTGRQAGGRECLECRKRRHKQFVWRRALVRILRQL